METDDRYLDDIRRYQYETDNYDSNYSDRTYNDRNSINYNDKDHYNRNYNDSIYDTINYSDRPERNYDRPERNYDRTESNYDRPEYSYDRTKYDVAAYDQRSQDIVSKYDIEQTDVRADDYLRKYNKNSRSLAAQKAERMKRIRGFLLRIILACSIFILLFFAKLCSVELFEYNTERVIQQVENNTWIESLEQKIKDLLHIDSTPEQ